MKQPDWEGFARAIMEHWPEGDVDGEDLQNTAEYYGLLRKEPFDPERHGYDAMDEWGMEPSEGFPGPDHQTEGWKR